jgi:UDP-galactopyranose mutase
MTFVFQRPQHLMSRFAQHSRVYFVEEPVFEGTRARCKSMICEQTGVNVVTPVLPPGTSHESASGMLRTLIRDLVREEQIAKFAAWYYTPMALQFSADLEPELTVYDCMDELSAFASAPVGMLDNERKLFERSDLIFTGGLSLFEAKRSRHENVHLFPSGVDVAHFSRALLTSEDPADQKPIGRPRLGYAGVIDERMDVNLIAHLADSHPGWQLILLGPVVKIDPRDLPRRANIHYLGMKAYNDLPSYFSGWDVALLPFALNAATRFISPTKTPEYLSAGLPVVSTPIRDVDRPYGKSGLVFIGHTPEHFVQGVEQELCEGRSPAWQAQVRSFLATISWGKTWSSMQRLMCDELERKGRIESNADGARNPIFRPQVSAAGV